MIKCNNWPIGLCTWSLGNDFDRISVLKAQTQLSHIHLAVAPALSGEGENWLAEVEKQGWTITATMIDFPQEDYSSLESIRATGGIVPDSCWQDNRKRVIDAIDITAQLGVKYLEFHFGFLERTKKFRDRVRLLAEAAAGRGVTLLMETGQETPEQLRAFLEGFDHPALAVNFDPGNMILYDKGKPAEALKILAPWIKHVHIKDAVKTQRPGTWGTEVAWGDGQVGGDNFLTALKKIAFSGALAVERESGDKKFEDIKLAIERLSSYSV